MLAQTLNFVHPKPACQKPCTCKVCPNATAEGLFSKLGLAQTSRRLISSFVRNNEIYNIYVVKGSDFSEMYAVYKLWYKIYVGELHYAYQSEDVNHKIDFEEETLVDYEPNSWVYVLENRGTYIGSLKVLPSICAKLSANFAQYLPKKNIYEISKFMLLPEFRDSLLSILLTKIAYTDIKKSLIEPHYYVCNAKEKLVHFYNKLSFAKISETPVISPLGNLSYLLACTPQMFGEVVKNISFNNLNNK